MIPRLILAASIVAGLAYPAVNTLPLPGWALIAAKGVCVGLLALYAASVARDRNGWLLAAVMALGMLGDVLLVFDRIAGGAAFAAGHISAIWLYLRNRRPKLTLSQRTLALLLPLFGLAMPTLVGLREGVGEATVYALLLTSMAATAWISCFPRYRTGSGAMLFVISDTLLIARLAGHLQYEAAGWAVWLTYYLGQLLITVGVSRTLARQ